MINIHNIAVAFGGTYLFKDIAFRLNAGDSVGLIGKNGAGKSTLLKILAKESEPDEGQMATDKDVEIGFLKQDIEFTQGRTVLEESYEAFEKIREIELKIDQINHRKSVRKHGSHVGSS